MSLNAESRVAAQLPNWLANTGPQTQATNPITKSMDQNQTGLPEGKPVKEGARGEKESTRD